MKKYTAPKLELIETPDVVTASPETDKIPVGDNAADPAFEL